MAIKKYKPNTPGQRGMTVSAFDEITKSAPEKSLTVTLKKHAGRNQRGKITVRHRGGGYRPKYRIIDFKRIKDDVRKEGIGGKENVVEIDNCITRLRLEVKDNTIVDEKKIKSAGVAGVLRPGKNNVQVIIGTKVQFVADEFKKLCK